MGGVKDVWGCSSIRAKSRSASAPGRERLKNLRRFVEAGAVGRLKIAQLGLVGGGVGVILLQGEVELFNGVVLLAGGSGEEDVGLFSLDLRVEELELGVGDAGIIGIDSGGFGSVAVASELDEGLARVDLVAEDLAEIAALGAPDVLLHGFVAEELKDMLDLGAGGAEFVADGGDEDAWFHIFRNERERLFRKHPRKIFRERQD